VYILFFEYKTDRFYFLSAVLFPEAPMTILKHLFSPIRIGRMRAKNRLLMSAMSINFGVDENGYVTEQLTGYLAARARGGAGMIWWAVAASTRQDWNCPACPPCGTTPASRP
jgi:2,4-dienoyl-CoA reductase-like NADH-dependent reductase (Old Yellow Enzyme family)